jgi:hypothetical protein
MLIYHNYKANARAAENLVSARGIDNGRPFGVYYGPVFSNNFCAASGLSSRRLFQDFLPALF